MVVVVVRQSEPKISILARKDASDLGRHVGGALHEEALGGFGQHVAVDAVADQSVEGVPDDEHRLRGLGRGNATEERR